MRLQLIAILILYAGVQVEGENSAAVDLLSQRIKTFLENRCLQKLNIDIHKENIDLDVDLDDVDGDDDNGDEETILSIYNSLCKYIPKALYVGYGNVSNLVERCLDSQESYLPHLFINSFNATIHNVCKGSLNGFMSSFADIWIAEQECGTTIHNLGTLVLDGCIPLLQFMKDYENPEFVLKRTYFCSELGIVRQCMGNIVRKLCKKDTILSYGTMLLEPYETWC